MRRNVLLLQGPVGPFFSRFQKDLERRGFNVSKVNFNGGDSFFSSSKNSVSYTGKLKDWGAYLERLVKNKEIGRIYLFGDCRSYHRIAKKVALRHNIRVFVFEEGYIRPDFITLEEFGVNGYSPMMSKNLDYTGISGEQSPVTLRTRYVFIRTAIYSMLYYMSAAAANKKFRYYQHHRGFDFLPEGFRWIVSAVRKWRFMRKERRFLKDLMPQFEGNFFVCPLQVHCDMQVAVHSEFNSIEHFIGEVMTSFAKYAPSNKALVFKHHPMDRGYTDYSILFANLINEHGLKGRVFYVHDVCLPTLLKAAQGTVLINSTVGMSSLFHGTPVKTLGDAIYDLPDLTYQNDLDAFWTHSGTVDSTAYNLFREYLVAHNQLNGSMYRRLPGVGNTSGLIWSEKLSAEHEFREDGVDVSSGRQLKLVGGTGADISRQDHADDDTNHLDDQEVA